MNTFAVLATAAVFARFPNIVPHTLAFHAMNNIAPLPAISDRRKHIPSTCMFQLNKSHHRYQLNVAAWPVTMSSCILNRWPAARLGSIIEKNANVKNIPKNTDT